MAGSGLGAPSLAWPPLRGERPGGWSEERPGGWSDALPVDRGAFPQARWRTSEGRAAVADPEHVKRLRQTASLRRVPIAAVIIAAVAVLELLFAIWWRWGRSASTELIIAVGLALASPLTYGIWWLWWRLPKRQVDRLALPTTKESADVEDNFRKTVGQVIGGAAVLIGAGFALFQFLQQQYAAQEQQRTSQIQFPL